MSRASRGDEAPRAPGRAARRGRRGWTHPDIAGSFTGTGLDVLDIPGGLAPRAGATSGRGRYGPVHRAGRRDRAQRPGVGPARAVVPAAPDRVIEAAVDQLADAELRLLGITSDEAPASSSSLP